MKTVTPNDYWHLKPFYYEEFSTNTTLIYTELFLDLFSFFLSYNGDASFDVVCFREKICLKVNAGENCFTIIFLFLNCLFFPLFLFVSYLCHGCLPGHYGNGNNFGFKRIFEYYYNKFFPFFGVQEQSMSFCDTFCFVLSLCLLWFHHDEETYSHQSTEGFMFYMTHCRQQWVLQY